MDFPCPFRAADLGEPVTQGGGEYALPWAVMPCPFRAKKYLIINVSQFSIHGNLLSE
jgi:hypothetical protein